jgi:hypothetical protein
MPPQHTTHVIDLYKHVQTVGSQAQVSGGHLVAGCARLLGEIFADGQTEHPCTLVHRYWTTPQCFEDVCVVCTHYVEVSGGKRWQWLGSRSECCGPRVEICDSHTSELRELFHRPSTRTCLRSTPHM